MNLRAASTLAVADPVLAACATRAELIVRLARAGALTPHAPAGPGELTVLAVPGRAPEATIRAGGQSLNFDAAPLGLASACSFATLQEWTTVSASPAFSLVFDEIGAMRYAHFGPLETLGPGSWSIVGAHLARAEASHAHTRAASNHH